MKIVHKHSAILSAYRRQSIHANHTDMTTFSGANDPGYQVVSGELWLWANEVEERLASKPLQAQPTKNESLPNSDDLREKRGKKFATIADLTGEVALAQCIPAISIVEVVQYSLINRAPVAILSITGFSL